ncbi:MAG: acetylglutamate kinase [Alphaproteobacteria bacterium]|jgi:acetylglutamate kinase|nr:acetylglutamate kinase [Alphaproteobacteria bacterium]MDP6516609.1 acetylglutamate kinase [Alphaproteobacteria bacterium]
MTEAKDSSLDERLGVAATLSEALPYMRRFAGTTFVIKFGGHAMGEDSLADLFARDVVLLKQVGINPVVVHGGGPQIGRMLERLKIQSSFIDGLRVTDSATVEIVEMVLAGSINKQIVSAINGAGGNAVGLSGKDGNLLRARPLRHKVGDRDSNIEKVLDLGFVGEPDRVDPHVLECFARSDIIPVIAPVGFGADGTTFNINADMAAGAIASALGATKLVMMTDVAGVLDGAGALITRLDPATAETMLAAGTISGGMVPKVRTCLDAVAADTAAAHILDGRIPHVLLLEIFTEHGVGTMIVAD